jgi:glyoxylase-like metal-dependent hydrolase (beta-lactamase superfamily II)
LATVFLALAGLALWLACAEPPPPEPVAEAALPASLTKIADGVWFRMGERDQGHCNNVIIEMEDGLFLVDANFPSGAQLVMEDVKAISPKPVKWVFDTHHHGDHAYGNPVWTKAGATTLAYIGVAEEIKRYEPTGWQNAAKARPDVAALNLETLEPPQQTFSEIPHVIEDSTRRIELHHFGWAHTRGDGFVYLPNEKILCSGDAATNGPYNFTGHGNTGSWPNVIERAMALDADKVLPGHGPAGGREILAGQKAFFEFINAEVGAAHAAGKKLEDIVTLGEGGGVETTIQPPESVMNWVGPRFAEQVRVRYVELAEGKPHGLILGGE